MLIEGCKETEEKKNNINDIVRDSTVLVRFKNNVRIGYIFLYFFYLPCVIYF